MSNTSLSHRYSFSGSDTKVFGYYTGGSKYHLEAMHTLSCSVYEAKGRVRSLGFKSIRGFSRAVREISGTMIMVVVGGHPLRPLMDANPYSSSLYYGEGDPRSWSIDATETARGSSSLYQYGEDEGYFSERDTTRIPTTLPPFNLLVHFQSEIAVGSYVRGDQEEKVSNAAFELIDVEIMGEGIVTSVNDMITEIQYQFVARDYKEYALNMESYSDKVQEQDLLEKAEEDAWKELEKSINRLGATSAFRYESGDIEISSIINGSNSSPFLKELLKKSNAYYSSGDISYGSIPAKNEDLSLSNAVQNNQIDTIGVGDTIPIMAPSAEEAQDIIAQNSDPSNEELLNIVKDEIDVLENEALKATAALAKATDEEYARLEAEKRKKEQEIIAKEAEKAALEQKEAEEKARREEAERVRLEQEEAARQAKEEEDIAAAIEAAETAKEEWKENQAAAALEAQQRETRIAQLETQVANLSSEELGMLESSVEEAKMDLDLAKEELDIFRMQNPDYADEPDSLAESLALGESVADSEEYFKELEKELKERKESLESSRDELNSLKNGNSQWGSDSLDVHDPENIWINGSSWDLDEHDEPLEFYQIVDQIREEEQSAQQAVDFIRRVETGHPWSGLKIPGTDRNIDYYEIQRTNQGTLVKLYTKSSHNSYNYLFPSTNNVPQTFGSLYILMEQ